METILPQLAAEPEPDPTDPDATSKKPPPISDEKKADILGQYGLTCLSVATVYRWLKAMGFKYETRKKYFFVDGHEKVGTKKHRKKYVRELLKLEKWMYRWVQIKETDVPFY